MACEWARSELDLVRTQGPVIVHAASCGHVELRILAGGGVRGRFLLCVAPLGTLEAEADLSIAGIDPEDLDVHLVVGLDDVLRVLDLLVREFGDVQETFESFFELDEDTEVGDLRDRAVYDHAGFVGIRNGGGPGILGQLLDAESDSLLVLVDVQDNALDGVALLVLLVGVGDLLRPGHVRDMEQPVDAGLDFDEGAVVGEVPDLPLDDRSGRVPLGDEFPGIDLGLLDAQRDLVLLGIDVEYDHFDFVTDVDQFTGMVDSLGPGHLGDVDQSLDAL